MVLGSKKLGHLITKFERGDSHHDGNEESPSGRRRKRLTPKKSQKKQAVQDFDIGDKITLVDSPWKDCEGTYSCRAMRRPDFAESALVRTTFT